MTVSLHHHSVHSVAQTSEASHWCAHAGTEECEIEREHQSTADMGVLSQFLTQSKQEELLGGLQPFPLNLLVVHHFPRYFSKDPVSDIYDHGQHRDGQPILCKIAASSFPRCS